MPVTLTTDNLGLVGNSAAVKEINRLIGLVASSDCSVLVEGESGTGKELAARDIHARSARAPKPFIPINCAGISETLFESQFFGHVRGAFTGAEQSMVGLVRSAEGGVLFMDEVGEIPLNLQAKLLRMLQEGEVLPVGMVTPVPVDTRFIAATNRDLRVAVRNKEFREDLYYRLNVIRIFLPPLREHPEDVEPLIAYFNARCAQRHGSPPSPIPSKVCQQLAEYPWPGNVRELASWVERLFVLGVPPEVLADSLLADKGALAPDVVTLQEAERRAITIALKAAGSNRSQAAQFLGINRATLHRKLAQYQIA
jgi:DNA-binding NtrC family response regulator